MSEALFKMAFSGLTSEIALKQKELADLRDRLAKLLDDCPCTTLVQKEEYTSGGYDHRSMTETWDECIICGERSNHQTSYGTFQ